MKQFIVLISIFTVLLTSCIATKKYKQIAWENTLHGNVKAIYESKYNSSEDDINEVEFDTIVTIDTIVTPKLVDSSIVFFNEERLPIMFKVFCNIEFSNGEFSECVEQFIVYDKKNRVVGYKFEDRFLTFVKEHNKYGLPILVEMLNQEGETIVLARYKYNHLGLVLEEKRTTINNDLSTLILSEYNQKGLLVKQSYTYEAQLKDELVSDNYIETFEYLEFDKQGNWTKRKEIYDNRWVNFSYRTYEYYK